MKTFYFLVLLGVLANVESWAGAEPVRPKQFIYVLRLVQRLHDDKAWTEEDKAAVKSGQLILAGRTQETGDKTFGIAIFEAADENAARAFMTSDPAVVAGVMTAELHPFGVALERKNP